LLNIIEDSAAGTRDTAPTIGPVTMAEITQHRNVFCSSPAVLVMRIDS